MANVLMVIVGMLITLLEAVSTFVPYKEGRYRRKRRAKPAKKFGG